MRKLKLFNQSEESYWKSFTDIMAGLLLVILLVLMLLLLLMTQMEENENKYDKEYDNIGISNNDNSGKNDNTSTHQKDHDKENDYSSSGGGGKGSGVDDPGTKTQEGVYVDVGHDKTAVFVTVVDEETENVIKKAGILFELYASRNAQGGLQILRTYYPDKIEYKQYQTTEEGTFYLPEKITNGWYSLHNLKAPEGYGKAKDVNFEITQSLDWSEPFLVRVPLAPAKGIIYVQNVDAATKEKLSGGAYEVFAAEDIVTLDGTVRYKEGAKVDTFECDGDGKGHSKELYLGKYKVVQSTPIPYYALNKSTMTVELTDEDDETVHNVNCDKTAAEIKLVDEYSEEPIANAVFSVTGKENVKTDERGVIRVFELDKQQEYTVTPESVPSPYKFSSDPFTFKVDGDGYIEGESAASFVQTAYMTRLAVEVKDFIFDNNVAGHTVRLYDSSDKVLEEWESSAEQHIVEGLEPGDYTIEVDKLNIMKQTATVQDSAKLQKIEQTVWTWLDTGVVALALLTVGLIILLIVRIARRIKERKQNGKQKDKEK